MVITVCTVITLVDKGDVFISRPYVGLYQSTPTWVFGRYYIPLSVDPYWVFISRPILGLYQSTHYVGLWSVLLGLWSVLRGLWSVLRGLLHCSYNLLREIHLYQYQFRPFNLGISVFHFICKFDIITINKRLHLLIDYAHMFRLMNTLT